MTEESATAAPEEQTASTDVAVVEQHDVERQRANDVIENAAALALESSPLHHDEFMTLAMTAKMLSMSGAAPKYVRGNPHVAFHIALIGRDLGISPTLALNLIDIIPGKDKELEISLSPQLRAAQVKRLGIGILKPVWQKPDRAVWVALTNGGQVDHRCTSLLPDAHFMRKDSDGAIVESCSCFGIIGVTEFTWENAINAKLVDGRCRPSTHVNDCKCKYNWKTYDFRMCSWRAGGYCADDFFPEAAVGLYSPDELGAVVDVEGRAIDPSTIDMPQGYEPPQRATSPLRQMADPALLLDLQERIAALPNDEKADLAAKWKQHEKLSGTPARALDEGQLKLAAALVTGQENKAKTRVQLDVAEARVVVRRQLWAKLVELLGLVDRSDGSEASDSSDSDDQSAEVAQERETTGEAASEQSESTQQTTIPTDSPMTAEQVAEVAGEDAVTKAIADVKAMAARDVRAQLEARQLPTVGNVDKLRHDLTIALLREGVAQIEQTS